MCGAEREKDCPARADSAAFILHATADKALVLPDRGHKSPLGDAVPTAYTIPDDKHTIIHTAQHFFSPLSLGLAGARVTTGGTEKPAKPGGLPRGRGEEQERSRVQRAQSQGSPEPRAAVRAGTRGAPLHKGHGGDRIAVPRALLRQGTQGPALCHLLKPRCSMCC